MNCAKLLTKSGWLSSARGEERSGVRRTERWARMPARLHGCFCWGAGCVLPWLTIGGAGSG